MNANLLNFLEYISDNYVSFHSIRPTRRTEGGMEDASDGLVKGVTDACISWLSKESKLVLMYRRLRKYTAKFIFFLLSIVLERS